MRLGAAIFTALMITSVLGVIFPIVIEFPNELYYNADVQNVSQSYSYKPGQSGVQFFYFRQTDSGGYVEMNLIKTILISTVFYFGLVSFLLVLRRFVKWALNPDRREKETSNNLVTKLRLNVDKHKPVKLDRMISLLIVAAVFYLGHYNYFGDHAGPSSLTAFVPSHATYVPNGKGTGEILVADLKQDSRGALYFKDGEPLEYDSSIVFIKPMNSDKVSFVYRQGGRISNFNLFVREKSIWLVANPNLIKSFDLELNEKVSSAKDLAEKLGISDIGIHETIFMSDGRLRINLLDGTGMYYDFKKDKLVERLAADKDNGKFKLDRDGGDRWDLQHWATGRRQTADKDAILINAEIVYQNNKRCLVLSSKDITENSERYLSCFDKKGNLEWRITDKDFPETAPDVDVEMSDYEMAAQIDGPNVILVCSNRRFLAGFLVVNLKSGSIIRRIDYKDL